MSNTTSDVNPVDRLMWKLGCTRQSSFGRLVGASQSSVSEWRKAGRVPRHRAEDVWQAAAHKGVELDWSDVFPDLA